MQVGDDTSSTSSTASDEIASQHYAFLVDEDEFDQIFGRIRERGLDYWADPFRRERGRINEWDGGRGVYFDDPNGHLLEVIDPAVRQRRHDDVERRSVVRTGQVTACRET